MVYYCMRTKRMQVELISFQFWTWISITHNTFYYADIFIICFISFTVYTLLIRNMLTEAYERKYLPIRNNSDKPPCGRLSYHVSSVILISPQPKQPLRIIVRAKHQLHCGKGWIQINEQTDVEFKFHWEENATWYLLNKTTTTRKAPFTNSAPLPLNLKCEELKCFPNEIN